MAFFTKKVKQKHTLKKTLNHSFNNISPEREQRHELQVVYCPDKFNVTIGTTTFT